MRDLEQKLEAEKSSSKRSEHQVNRLRHQLERLQEEKSEGEASHRSDEALKRLQKQIRDLRSSLQDAEKREHDLVKKRRATVRVGGWGCVSMFMHVCIMCTCMHVCMCSSVITHVCVLICTQVFDSQLSCGACRRGS